MVGRGDKSPMVSVTNADPDRIAELLDEFCQDVRTVLPPVLSIRNGRRSVVITGTPEQLGRFELYCSQDHREGRGRAQEQAARRRGVLARRSTASRSRSASTRRGWPMASTWSTAGPKGAGSTPNWPLR